MEYNKKKLTMESIITVAVMSCRGYSKKQC